MVGGRVGSFWGCMKVIKGAVRMWKWDQFSHSMGQMKECETTLKELISGPVPLGQDELDVF